MLNDLIFVSVLIIWTILIVIAQKSLHLVLIKVNIADIVFVIFIICIICTCIAYRHDLLLPGCVF